MESAMNPTVRRRPLPAWYVGLVIAIVAIVSIPAVSEAYFAWQLVISGIPVPGLLLALVPTIFVGSLYLVFGAVLVVLPTIYLGLRIYDRRAC